MYACGKRGGGGVELHIWKSNIYIIFDFCFNSFETFFRFKNVSHNFQLFLCTK